MNFLKFQTAAGVYLASVNLSQVSGIVLNSTAAIDFQYGVRYITITFADANARTAFLASLNDVSKDANWASNFRAFTASSTATGVTAADA